MAEVDQENASGSGGTAMPTRSPPHSLVTVAGGSDARHEVGTGDELLNNEPLQEHVKAEHESGNLPALHRGGEDARGSGSGAKHLWLDGWFLASSTSRQSAQDARVRAGGSKADADIRPHEPTCKPRSTLGFKYKAVSMAIVSLEDGGPAHKNGNVHTDDRIVAINEHRATHENIESLLRADDPPGTVVDMQLEDSETGALKHIRLTRAPLPASASDTIDWQCVDIKAPREFQF